jgi:transcriptional regulator with XRE-family HTH domain
MALNPERLKEARMRRGMNQRELADLCGFSDVQLSRYETGRMQPALENLELIARHLQVSIDYLLNLSDDPQKIYSNNDLKSDEILMIETYRRNGWAGIARLMAEHLEK